MFKHFKELGREKYGCEILLDDKLKHLIKLIPNDKEHGVILSDYDLEHLLKELRSP